MFQCFEKLTKSLTIWIKIANTTPNGANTHANNFPTSIGRLSDGRRAFSVVTENKGYN